MAKVKGSEARLLFGGVEYPFDTVDFSGTLSEIEQTDSATGGAGKSYRINRKESEFTVTANVYEVDGAEVSSGTLTANTLYRVTLGEIIEGSNTYSLGEIFESDGTGEASDTNKVKPLGSVVSGSDLALTIAGSELAVTEISYSETYDVINGTDSGTASGYKDFEVTRAERSGSFTEISLDDTADLVTDATGTPATFDLSVTATTKVVGKAVITSKDTNIPVSDYVKNTYNYRLNGSVTETNWGILADRTTKAFQVIQKKGSASNKAFTGNAVLSGKSFTANVDTGEFKVTYTFKVSGSYTETEYSES